MKVTRLALFSLVVCAAMGAFALYVASTLPAGASLPTHWNLAGEVDRSRPALQALLIPVWVGLGLSALFTLVPWIEPLQDRLEGSAALMRTAWLGTLSLLAALQGFIAAPGLGVDLKVQYFNIPLGLLFLAIGNMLPKSRPGFFVGIRTPWTIVDEDVWIATHRLGGKLFMLAGAILVAIGIVRLPAAARAFLTIGPIVGAALVPTVYSWWLWRRGRNGQHRTG